MWNPVLATATQVSTFHFATFWYPPPIGTHKTSIRRPAAYIQTYKSCNNSFGSCLCLLWNDLDCRSDPLTTATDEDVMETALGHIQASQDITYDTEDVLSSDSSSLDNLPLLRYVRMSICGPVWNKVLFEELIPNENKLVTPPSSPFNTQQSSRDSPSQNGLFYPRVHAARIAHGEQSPTPPIASHSGRSDFVDEPTDISQAIGETLPLCDSGDNAQEGDARSLLQSSDFSLHEHSFTPRKILEDQPEAFQWMSALGVESSSLRHPLNDVCYAVVYGKLSFCVYRLSCSDNQIHVEHCFNCQGKDDSAYLDFKFNPHDLAQLLILKDDSTLTLLDLEHSTSQSYSTLAEVDLKRVVRSPQEFDPIEGIGTKNSTVTQREAHIRGGPSMQSPENIDRIEDNENDGQHGLMAPDQERESYISLNNAETYYKQYSYQLDEKKIRGEIALSEEIFTCADFHYRRHCFLIAGKKLWILDLENHSVQVLFPSLSEWDLPRVRECTDEAQIDDFAFSDICIHPSNLSLVAALSPLTHSVYLFDVRQTHPLLPLLTVPILDHYEAAHISCRCLWVTSLNRPASSPHGAQHLKFSADFDHLVVSPITAFETKLRSSSLVITIPRQLTQRPRSQWRDALDDEFEEEEESDEDDDDDDSASEAAEASEPIASVAATKQDKFDTNNPETPNVEDASLQNASILDAPNKSPSFFDALDFERVYSFCLNEFAEYAMAHHQVPGVLRGLGDPGIQSLWRNLLLRHAEIHIIDSGPAIGQIQKDIAKAIASEDINDSSSLAVGSVDDAQARQTMLDVQGIKQILVSKASEITKCADIVDDEAVPLLALDIANRISEHSSSSTQVGLPSQESGQNLVNPSALPHPICACGLFDSQKNPDGQYIHHHISEDENVEQLQPLRIPKLSSDFFALESAHEKSKMIQHLLEDLCSKPCIRTKYAKMLSPLTDEGAVDVETNSDAYQTCRHRKDLCLFEAEDNGVQESPESIQEVLADLKSEDPFFPLGVPVNDSLIALLKSKWPEEARETSIADGEDYWEEQIFDHRPKYVDYAAASALRKEQQDDRDKLYEEMMLQSGMKRSGRDGYLDHHFGDGAEDQFPEYDNEEDE